MPETTIKLFDIILGGAATFFTFLWGLLAWNGNRLVNRVDSHDSDLTKKVDRDEYNGTINSIRKDMSTNTDRLVDKIEESNTVLNTRIEKLTEAVYTRRRGEDA